MNFAFSRRRRLLEMTISGPEFEPMGRSEAAFPSCGCPLVISDPELEPIGRSEAAFPSCGCPLDISDPELEPIGRSEAAFPRCRCLLEPICPLAISDPELEPIGRSEAAAREVCTAETPASAPLPPKDGKAVGFISSFFKKKRQINFFRRAPKYEEKLASSPCSDLTEQSVEEEHHAMRFGLACIFPYEELKEATNRFHESQVLGGGGFGRVYLGNLKDGRRVAVKKLYDDNPKQLEQFFNEVTVLSRLRHKNLVALYGCTNPQSRKKLLLVYEFISNGTVADHLHGQRPSLPWAVRIRIAIETAEALTYLHSLEPPIIHRDVKTSNILLDNAFQVKVADLGMCRLLPWDTTYVSTAPQGTMGYRDPEYDLYCKLTDKSDVYSFGVVLLELVSGKQAVDVNRDLSEIYLIRMGLNKIQNNQVEQLVDPELGYHSKWEIKRMVDSVIELACKCLQAQGHMRPPMIEVIMVLKTIEEMVKTEEASVVDLLKNNVTLRINQISTALPPTQITEIKMQNNKLPIEAAREATIVDPLKNNVTLRINLTSGTLPPIQIMEAKMQNNRLPIEEAAREATVVDPLKNNVTVRINQTSTTLLPTQIMETIMHNNRLPIEAAREATDVDPLKNNVTLRINHTSTTLPPIQIMEIKMQNNRLLIDEGREVAFSGFNNILYASEIELGETYKPSYLPSNSGFIVYHGKFTDGRTVKVLKERNPERMEEIYKVVSSHSSFRHQNLVTLYGCLDKQSQELLLAYELLPNGTLADHLQGKHLAEGALTLDVRIQIAIDTAQALAYLQSFYLPVVHGRVKTDAILLDYNFSAKVVDLGLCHLLHTENEQYNKLSEKWDVYSFGVVLMELISGSQVVDINRECDEIHVTSLHKKLKLLVDNKLRYGTNSEIRWSVSSMAQLAFRCLQPNENKRPHMEEVLRILKCIRQQQTILKKTSQQSSQSSTQRDIGQSWLAEQDVYL